MKTALTLSLLTSLWFLLWPPYDAPMMLTAGCKRPTLISPEIEFAAVRIMRERAR